METQPPVGVRSRLTFVLVGLVFAAGGAAVWYFYFREVPPALPATPERRVESPPPPDPRLTFPTPFQNVRPDVKYVGDAKCAACHADITHSYHQHPMGRSATLDTKDTATPNAVQKGFHTLTVVTDGDRVRHRLAGNSLATADVPPYEAGVDIVIGSGTRGKSYLTVDRGAVWQSAVSWFRETNKFDVSPGFELGQGGRRPVPSDCLFCHTHQSDPIPQTRNLYRQPVMVQANIGCERCHGPGELHVRKQSDAPAAGRDDTVVNPKHLSADLQLDICRQCHLLGEQRVVRRGRELSEFRPGLPLEQFLSVFVKPPEQGDKNGSVGQFEQLARSKCFTTSGTMTCTTCHDPHKAPAAADVAAFYRGKCLTCHDTRGCSQPEPVRKAVADNCVNCHMPRGGSGTIPHVSVVDHSIPRRQDGPRGDKPSAGGIPVPYPPGPHAPPADERDRDYGIALLLELQKKPNAAARRLAAEKLTAAVDRLPDDAVAWLRLGGVSILDNQPRKQAEAVRRAAELQPDSEEALFARAGAELNVGETDTALGIIDRLIRMNPAAVEYLQMRASTLIVKKDHAAAEKACRDALALNSMSAETHVLLAMALNGLGRKAEAKKAADAGLALETNPAVQSQYRDWLGPRR